MDVFCGNEEFLDFNQTWYTHNPQLSVCLIRSVVLVPPVFFSFITFCYSLFYLIKKRNGKKGPVYPWSWVLMVRLVLLILCLMTQLAQVIYEHMMRHLHPVDVFYFTVSIVIIISQICCTFMLKHAGKHSSSLQFFYWLAQVISLSFGYLNNSIGLDVPYVYSVLYAASILLLFSEWFPCWPNSSANSLPDGLPDRWPNSKSRNSPLAEDRSSFLSRLAFSWLSPVFFRGFRKSLTIDDLPYPTSALDVNMIAERFYADRLKCDKVDKRGKHVGVARAIWRSFGPTFLIGAGLRFLNDILLYLSPLVFRQIVNNIETNDLNWKGYSWVAILFITAVTQVTVSNQYFRQTYLAAFQMRTGLILAIYRKTLTISNSHRQEYSGGEIANIMAIDTERIIEIVPFLNSIWSAPFQFCLAMYFLFNLVGKSALVGIAIFGILIPVNILAGKYGRKIQTNQMNAKDDRNLLMSEVLQGIKMVKFYAWESAFTKKVCEYRDKEIRSIRSNAILQSLLWVTYTASPLLVTLAIFLCYICIDPENNVLTAEKVFGTVSIINVLSTPMQQFPRFLMESMKLYISINRIDEYLTCDDTGKFTESETLQNTSNVQRLLERTFSLSVRQAILKEKSLMIDGPSVDILDGDFTWNNTSPIPTLKNINITINQGELVAVIGKIGSGKTSLLASIMGELNKVNGSVKVAGTVSYAAQNAWIQNLTVKENILFGTEFDSKRYNSVLNACALRTDLNSMVHGDATQLGENGGNLSGGQKQRIGLARAAYNYSDIVILDDPLSAVDPHTGRHIFQKLISNNGLLQGRTRIVSTHSLSFLNQVDKIILIHEGRVLDIGTLEQLTKNNTYVFQQLLTFLNNKSEEKPDAEKVTPKETPKSPVVDEDTESSDITEQETTKKGRVSSKHYIYYFKSANVILSIIVILLYLSTEGFKVGSNIVLAKWTNNFGASQNLKYIGYYGLLAVACSLTGIISNALAFYRCASASKKIHNVMIDQVMHAPLSFFDANPTGRIVNRFTSDMEVVDQKISIQIAEFLSSVSIILGTFSVIVMVTPSILISLVPITIAFVFLQIYYSRTRRQLKRMETVAKSPIFSFFSESIFGTMTIRAFGQLERFCGESEKRVAEHLFSNYLSVISSRWLSIRVEVLGNVIVFFAAVFSFYWRESLSAGLAALSISYAMQMIDRFGWTIRMSSELESDSVALERIREYEKLPQEANWQTTQLINDEKKDFPGEIVFEDYCTSYRPGLPNIMNDFNLRIPHGEKVGVVGRTGAGKSSLAMALFRILEPTGGRIRVGGVDTSTLGLHDLRSRLTIIPQEPVLFSGSVQFNLDPAGVYPGAQVTRALEDAGLNLEDGIQQEVKEGGGGLSLGQKQLLCLARALLRKSKVLMLDEATAAIDAETDLKTQETIRTKFNDCTVITVAHRINTVMGLDRVLVLERGRIVEDGPPLTLVQDKTSRFYQMARADGVEISETN